MLKSYKKLARWYSPLEPQTGAPVSAHPDEEQTALGDDGPARYPHYIRDEETEQYSADISSDLPSRRSEFSGGWTDWVADHAPGTDDDYTVPRGGSLVRFPWPDDEYDQRRGQRAFRSNRALRPVARERGSRRDRAIVVLALAVLLLAAAIGVVLLLHSSDRGAVGPTDAAGHASVQFTAGSVQSVDAADVPCPTERSATIVRGAESGGTTSGPDAVLAFQYAYYVERSGERVREVVAPDAVVSPATVIQRGIDSIPAGTTHCVRIVAVAEDKYSVEVTEYRPGGVPATYNKQMVTTAAIAGRTLITGITAG